MVCTKTGVKHLHAEAHHFDVGIYFEANGHGAVLFKPELLAALEGVAGNSGNPSAAKAEEMLAFAQMINQAVGTKRERIHEWITMPEHELIPRNHVVLCPNTNSYPATTLCSAGDAISVVLMVETILARRGWGMREWSEMYTDIPSRQLKVVVPDRSKIKTAQAERVCVEPAGLQPRIDAAVAKVAKGRAFVRPSGTEDIVRVYAEAATRDEAEALAAEVAEHVKAILC